MEDSIKPNTKVNWTRVFNALLKEYQISICPTEYLVEINDGYFSNLSEDEIKTLSREKPLAVYQTNNTDVADVIANIEDFKSSRVWEKVYAELKQFQDERSMKWHSFVNLVEKHLHEVNSDKVIPQSERFLAYNKGGRSFLMDNEKRMDFLRLDEEEFLATYPDVSSIDCDATVFDIFQRISSALGKNTQAAMHSFKDKNKKLQLEDLTHEVLCSVTHLRDDYYIFADSMSPEYLAPLRATIAQQDELYALLSNEVVDYSSIKLNLVTDEQSQSLSRAGITFSADVSLHQLADIVSKTALRFYYQDYSQLHKYAREHSTELKPHIRIVKNMYINEENNLEPDARHGLIDGFVELNGNRFIVDWQSFDRKALDTLVEKYASEHGTSREQLLEKETNEALRNAAEKRTNEAHGGKPFFSGKTMGELGFIQVGVGRYDSGRGSTIYNLRPDESNQKELFARNKEIGDGLFKDYDDLRMHSDISLYVSAEKSKSGKIAFSIVQESDDYGNHEYTLPLVDEEKKALSSAVLRMDKEFQKHKSKTKRIDDIDDR